MNSIQMLGKLVIKQVVTDGYKQKAGGQFQVEIEKIEQDIKTYEESMNKAITKLTLQGEPNVEMYRRQFMAEKDKLVAYKDQLKASLQAILDLPDGEIIETGEGNFLQEVTVGQPFTASVSCEVLLKDDIVIAINPQQA
ncbi:MAG: hypothetical protein IJN31_08345 [Peptococcaceae bacterium]|nr:hypothetical protein [Peptococcaceae bacterium]MBQ2994633.1 hypothetical protein [Peptococcaceae bacterium]MBQ7026600.1 hypothetical protein [Peptococcaceae bacterium]